jgi:cyclopropane-fatty-acyl-phospholipid synthase
MSSYLPKAITAPVGHGTDLLRSTLGSISWGPALSLSKLAIKSTLSRIEFGTLIVKDEVLGGIQVFGQKVVKEHKRRTNGHNDIRAPYHKGRGPKTVELVIKKETFWVRLFLFGDMGFAESYMLEEVECLDLSGFFQVRLPTRKVLEIRTENRSCLFITAINLVMRQP